MYFLPQYDVISFWTYQRKTIFSPRSGPGHDRNLWQWIQKSETACQVWEARLSESFGCSFRGHLLKKRERENHLNIDWHSPIEQSMLEYSYSSILCRSISSSICVLEIFYLDQTFPLFFFFSYPPTFSWCEYFPAHEWSCTRIHCRWCQSQLPRRQSDCIAEWNAAANVAQSWMIFDRWSS